MLDLVKNNSIIFSILLSTSSCVGYYLYNRRLQDDKKAGKIIYIKVFLTILALTYGLIYIFGNNSKSSKGKSILDFVPKFSKSKGDNLPVESKNKITPDLIEKLDIKKENVNTIVTPAENKQVTNTPKKNDNQVNTGNANTRSDDNLSPSPQLSLLKNQSSNVEKFLTGNPNF